MQAYRQSAKAALCFYLALSTMHAASGQGDAQSHFHRGYFLQHEKGDVEAALKEYEAALDQDASRDVRRQVREQIDAIQETIASRDLARLMPADALAYVEFARAGDHLEKLIRTMGLMGHKPTGERVVLHIDDGLALPSDFQVSPKLIQEFKKIHGAAIAITEIDFQHEQPRGVAVIHTGDSDLLGGLVDTGMQVIPRNETIEGFDTYCIENELWLVKTKSMIILSDRRDSIADVCKRLKSSADNLANNEQFEACQNERNESMIFAFVNVPTAMEKYGKMLQGEAAMARMLLGLDHIQHITAAVGATESGAAAHVRCAFDENQQSLAYGFLRTVPLKDSTLARIPAGSAVVAALGINPQMGMLAGAADAPKQITGLDIGRELFANIREVGLFVRPTAATDEIPDFGFAITAHDAQKSEMLWNQLLTLSSKIEDSGIKAEDVSIAGREARRYTLPDDDAPQLVVLRLDDETMIVGTDGAVRSAANAGKNGSLMSDERMSQLVGARSEHTCKAVFADLGRLLQLASLFEDDKEIAIMQKVLSNSNVSLVSEESTTEFKLRLEASGLPLFEDMVKTAATIHRNDQRVARAASYSSHDSDDDDDFDEEADDEDENEDDVDVFSADED